MPFLDSRTPYDALDVRADAYAYGIEFRYASDEDRLSHLDIVRYDQLGHVTYDRTGTRMSIKVFSVGLPGRPPSHLLTIDIRGRNLLPILEAIRLGTCNAIQQYSEAEYMLPESVDPGAPFIERITVEEIRRTGSAQ